MCPGIPKSRGIYSMKNELKPCSVPIDGSHAFNIQLNPSTQLTTNPAFQHEHKDKGLADDRSSQETLRKSTLKVFAATALTSIGVHEFSFRNEFLAEEKDNLNIEQEIINKENR